MVLILRLVVVLKFVDGRRVLVKSFLRHLHASALREKKTVAADEEEQDADKSEDIKIENIRAMAKGFGALADSRHGSIARGMLAPLACLTQAVGITAGCNP